MSQEKDFSLISVNEDDEVVIQAGVVSESDSTSDDVTEDFDGGTEDDSVAVEPRDEYRETTLEDLKETGPFSKMRLAILAGGLAAVVIFVVSFIVMR